MCGSPLMETSRAWSGMVMVRFTADISLLLRVLSGFLGHALGQTFDGTPVLRGHTLDVLRDRGVHNLPLRTIFDHECGLQQGPSCGSDRDREFRIVPDLLRFAGLAAPTRRRADALPFPRRLVPLLFHCRHDGIMSFVAY